MAHTLFPHMASHLLLVAMLVASMLWWRGR